MFRAFFVLWLSAFAFENCNAHVRHANDVSLYSKFIQQQCLQKSQPENVSVKPSQTQCVTYYSPLNTFSVDIIVEGHFENQSLAQLQISYTEVSDDIKNSWSSFRTSQGQFSIPLIDEPIPKSTILCFSNNNQNEKDTTHVHYCIIPSVSSHSRESPSYKSTSPYETTVGILVKGLFRNIVVTTFKRLVLALDACLQIEDQFMEVFGPMLGPSKVSSNESLTQRKEVELELKEQDEELRTSQHVDEALWMSQFRNFLFIAFVGGWTILWLAPKKFKLLKRFLIFLTGFLRETPQWIREQLMLFLRPGEIKESNSESLEKKFPPEVLEKIFSHLTPKDLLTTRRVSSSLRDVIDTTRVWDTKYRELFKTEPIKNAPGPIRLCDRETFFYRQCAETNMANSGRPKFRSVEFLDVHQSSVLCVSSCNNIVVSYAANSTTISANSATPLPPVHQQYFPDPNHRFQHEHLGIIHVCDTITEKLLQSICVPTRVKLLKVCKLAPDHIVVYGESGHDNAFREGNLFVWNFVPRDNRAPSNLFYGDRVYRTTQPGCWVPKWSRSIYRNDIYDQFAEVKAVEFLDMVPLPNLGLAVMTASHTANLIHFWSLQSWGKYLVSIQTEFKYIWDVLPLEYDRNTFIYVVGDTFLDVFKFEKSFSRFLKVHRVSLSELFDLNLTLIQGNVVNQLHTSLENMPWSMKVKINEISQKLQFLILHRRGNARTIVHHCLVSYHNPFSFVLSSKWETELFAKFSAVDFNEHMAVLAKENSTTIHRLPLVPPSITGGKKAVARPLFENTGSVTCLHVTDDKICVGCEGLNSVHIWDFSCMESPKPNTTPGGAEILKITWLLLTHTFAIRTQQMYSSKFLHHWRRVVSLTLSLLPIFLIFFLNSCYTGIVLLLVLYFMLCSSKSSVRKHPLRFLLIILIVGEWHSAITTPENSLFYRLSPHQDSNLYYYIDTQSDINGSLSLMQYMPLLWLLILTSGIEIGMKSSSGGRAILSLPYSYYIMVVVLLNLAYYGDNQDDRHSVVSSFFFYDWWFIIIGLIKGLILHSMYDPLEIFAWILLPYVVEMIQVTLIGLASFVANVFFDSPVWSHLPPLLTLTNMILRTHMSCYIYFNNVIAVSMAAKEPSLFIKHGGLVAIYIVLLIIAYVVL